MSRIFHSNNTLYTLPAATLALSSIHSAYAIASARKLATSIKLPGLISKVRNIDFRITKAETSNVSTCQPKMGRDGSHTWDFL